MLALAALTAGGQMRVGRAWMAACAIAIGVVTVQWGLGRIHFGGDAWMVVLYLAGLLWALAIGGQWADALDDARFGGIDLFMAATLCSATASVGIALVQWTGAVSLGVWMADMPPGGRPFGNVAQPNHLCTIAFLGIVATGWLRVRGRVGPAAFWVMFGWFAFGMVLTGSRTGLIQMGFLVLFLALMRRRSVLHIRLVPLCVAAFGYVAAVALWPSVGEALYLNARLAEDSGTAGTRPLHWRVLINALAIQPSWGYGWQQVGIAQQHGVDFVPVAGEYIEHAHNLLLDLLIWNGLPLGLLLAGLLLWIFISRVVACRSATTAWLLVGIGGLGAHAMLEFPLEFAYFLIPLGLMAGAVDRMTDRSTVAVSAGTRALAGSFFAGLLALVAWDYVQAETSFRSMRMELARIGDQTQRTEVPKMRVLTQLEAWLIFTQTPATPGMSPESVDAMRRVSERYAYPPAMLRYGLAAGLNGRPQQARLTLQRLCRIHGRARCDEGREAWGQLQKRYPQLLEVAWPATP